MPQKRMECFRLPMDYFAWTEHGFLSGIRDSRKARESVRDDESVIYWPSTEPSIMRCTFVNKRENSGSRCTLDNNNQMPRRFESVGDKMPKWEPAPGRGLWALSDPRLSYPGQDAQVLLCSREELWVNVAVCPCLHSFLTHNKHPLFENKAWEIIFL